MPLQNKIYGFSVFVLTATVPTVDLGDWLCKMLGICA